MSTLNAGQKVFVMQLLCAQVASTGKQPSSNDLHQAAQLAMDLDGEIPQRVAKRTKSKRPRSRASL